MSKRFTQLNWIKKLAIMFVPVFALVVTGVWFVFSARAEASPSIITYQGKILVGGASATTSLPISFTIYDTSATGTGNALYTAAGITSSIGTITITPNNGLFSINLGDTAGTPATNILNSNIFKNNSTLYLEVVIDGQTLSPRKRITASPYAINSTYAATSTYAETAGTSTYATSAGSALTANTSTYANSAGTSTYSTSAGSALTANTSTYATNAGSALTANTSTYSTNAGTSTYSNTAGSALTANTSTYATSAGSALTSNTSTYASTAGSSLTSGTSTYAFNAGTSTYASSANLAIFANTAGSASTSITSTYATTAGNTNLFSNLSTSSFAILNRDDFISGHWTFNGITTFNAASTFTTATINNLTVTSTHLTGALYDYSNSTGVNGQILQSTGSGVSWVSTNTLGFLASESDPIWIAASTSYANLYLNNTFTGINTFATATFSGNVGIGTTTPSSILTVAARSNGNTNLQNWVDYNGYDLMSISSSTTSGVDPSANLFMTAGGYANFIVGNANGKGGWMTLQSGSEYGFNGTQNITGLALKDIDGNIGGELIYVGGETPWSALTLGNGTSTTTLFNDAFKFGINSTSSNGVFYVDSAGHINNGIWNANAITAAKGGTGQDSSGWTGFAYISGGTWSTSTVVTAESDPIWMASSSSYLTTSSAAANYLTIDNASSTYLKLTGGILSGALTINNNLTVTGTSTIHNLLPDMIGSTDNMSLYNLGASNSRWSNVWSQYVNVGTSTYSLSGDNGTFAINSSASGSGTNRLVIDSNGNVGIGAITPSQLFDVNNKFTVDSFGNISASGTFSITTSTITGSLTVTNNIISNGNLSVTGNGTSTFDYGATFATAGGNVGINKTNPTQKLDVSGGISNLIDANSGIEQIGTTPVGINPRSIVVAGRYAYVANYGSNSISVVDISNPSAPVEITTTSIGINPRSIVVAGRYAYVANYGSNSISVVDISNPSAPVEITTTSVGVQPYSVAISGHYAYIANDGDNTISILDVSNPYAPIQIATTSVGINPRSIAVAGRYAYVANASDSSISVVDVSNPSAPTEIATTYAGTSPSSIVVSGQYAYIANTYPGSNIMSVVDVSNPYLPIKIATTTVGNYPAAIAVSGRYAYVGGGGVTVVDISNPALPVNIVEVSVDTGPTAIAVSGRYAYVVGTGGGNDIISVIDLKGTETSNLIAHSAEAGQLTVKNDIIANGVIQANTSLFVGAGGIFSNGALSVSATNTPSYFGGAVGIGTTTPAYPLTVSGTAYISGNILSGGNLTITGTGTSTFSYGATFATDGGRVGVGTVNPTSNLHVYGTTDAGTVITSQNTNTNAAAELRLTADTENYYIQSLGSGVGGTLSNAFRIYDATQAATRFLITSDGKVGVGTIVPGSPLTVSGSGLPDTPVVSITPTHDGSTYGATFGLSVIDSALQTGNYVTNLLGVAYSTNNIATFNFNYEGSGSTSNSLGLGFWGNDNILSVVATGNVGIGTTTPSSKLTVVGDVSIFGTSTLRNILPDMSGGTGNMSLYNLGASTSRWSNVWSQYVNVGTSTYSLSADNGTFAINSAASGGGTNRLVIDSSGYVGIGTTTPTALLDVNNSFTVNNAGDVTMSGSLKIGGGRNSNHSITNPGVSLLTIDDTLAPLAAGTFAANGDVFMVYGNVTQGALEIYGKGKISHGDGGAELKGARSVFVAGKYAYVAAFNSDALEIIDISNTATPTHAGLIVDNGSNIKLDGARSVFVSGKYAYVAAANSDALEVIDISNPTSPRHAGSISNGDGGALLDNPYSVYVSGKYAYVASYDSDALEIIDISNPTTPAHVSSIATSGHASSVKVVGNYAYVLMSGALEIIDITNPNNPTSAGSYNPSAGASSLFVAGNYAYIGCESGEASAQSVLEIVDVSTPNNNQLVSKVSFYYQGLYLLGRIDGLVLNGNYLYALGPGLSYSQTYGVVIDVSGASISNAQIGSLNIGNLSASNLVNFSQGLSVNGGLSVGASGILSNGAISVFATNTASYFGGSVGIGTTTPSTLLTVAGTSTLRNVLPDMTGSSGNMSLYNLGASTSRWSNVWSQYVNVGTSTYSLSGDNGTFVINSASSGSGASRLVIDSNGNVGISSTTPSQLFDVANKFTVDLSGNITASGTFSIFSSDTSTVAGKLSVISNITSGGVLSVTGAGTSTFNYGATFATVGGNVGINKINPIQKLDVSGGISNLIDGNTGAAEISSTTVGAGPRGMALSNNYLYVLNNSSSTLSVVDVSNSSAPAEISSTTLGGTPLSLAISGDYAYILSDSGIIVEDISNPSAPVEVSLTSLSSYLGVGITISGHYAYVTALQIFLGGARLFVFDISNPYSLTETSATVLPDNAFGYSIAVSGRYAYIADIMNSAVYAIDISNPSSPTQISTTSVGYDPYSIVVDGRYAYVANSSSTSNSVTVLDISNPSAPVSVLDTPVGAAPGYLFLAGDYLYVDNFDSSTISVLNIKNPRAPVSVATIPVTNGAFSFIVSGRYAYLANYLENAVYVLDLKGTETSNLLAHSAAVGQLSVQNDIIANGIVSAKTSLFVGAGGILSNGALAISATNTPSYFGGSLGIGTTTPSSKLTVVGDSYISQSLSVGQLNLSGNALFNITATSSGDSYLQKWYDYDGTELASLSSSSIYFDATGEGTPQSYGGYTNFTLGNASGKSGFLTLQGGTAPGMDIGGGGIPDVTSLIMRSASGTIGVALTYLGTFGEGARAILHLSNASSTSELRGNSLDVGMASGTIFENGGFFNVYYSSDFNTGKVGIGTPSPSTVLTVVGTSTLQDVMPDMAGGAYNMSLYNLGASTSRWSNVWAQYVNVGTSTWSLSGDNGTFAINSTASGGGTNRLVIDSNGNVGIGTTTPAQLFDVNNKFTVDSSGNISASGTLAILNASTSTITGALTVSNNLSATGVLSITGNGTSTFNYGATFATTGGNVGINKTNPTQELDVSGGISNLIDANSGIIEIATMPVGGLESQPYSITVSGRYAYVANLSSNSISVVDISNPSAPIEIATTSVEINPMSITVSGRYAYVANLSSNSISVVDISNPSAPIQVATTSVDSSPRAITVSGRYAYVANFLSNSISVVDISNPLAPIQVATTSVDSSPRAITVSGRYAYVANGNLISIIKISNPLVPIQVATTSVGNGASAITVSGRYAYLTNVSSESVSVVDISNPLAPIQITTVSVGSAPISITVSGRYAYVANAVDGTISVIDLKGTETSNLIAHSTEVGQLTVQNDIIANGVIQANTSLSVGIGGILSNGALVITATNTASYFGGAVTIGGVTSTAYQFYVVNTNGMAGYVKSDDGSWANTSDARAKKNISTITNSLNAVMAMNPVYYDNIGVPTSSVTGTQIGFIAQEMEQILPQVVDTNPITGMKAISYAKLTPILAAAIKEQQAQINALIVGFASSSSSTLSKLTIDTSNVFSQKITFKDHVTFSEDSIGQVKILTGATSTYIGFKNDYDNLPVITATPLDFLSGNYRVVATSTLGFLIEVAQAQEKDVMFNWHAFGADPLKIHSSDGTVQEVNIKLEPDGTMTVIDTTTTPIQGDGGATTSTPSGGDDQTTPTSTASSTESNTTSTPSENPPAETPPAETPPVEIPPAPPAETPPVENPPTETPSTPPASPPVETPPAPPADVPPPAETPSE